MIWRSRSGLETIDFCPRLLYAKRVSLAESKESQNHYLSAFSNYESGKLRSWAKVDMNRLHKSIKLFVHVQFVWKLGLQNLNRKHHTRVYDELGMNSLKKFAVKNLTIPSTVPNELKDLTQIDNVNCSRFANHEGLQATNFH